MDASILIVTKNRKDDLAFTLHRLAQIIDKDFHEILVFMDGCTDGTEALELEFPWVYWQRSKESLGASRARHILYKSARGHVLFGFDDDAHPLQHDFIDRARHIFESDDTIGIIAFKEVRGIYKDDKEALDSITNKGTSYFCNMFVGCGFAILKSVYLATNGFPNWMDIYGEEDCVSIEVLANAHRILFTTDIAVNHRIDSNERMQKGRHYYRFEKQLTNETAFFLVYYPNPIKALLRLYWNNFKTYAIKDTRYFYIYIKVILVSFVRVFRILKFRNPVSGAIIKIRRQLKIPGI